VDWWIGVRLDILTLGWYERAWLENRAFIILVQCTTSSCGETAGRTPFCLRPTGRFYFLLQEGVEKYGHRVHAFCLMTNHVHLAIQVGEVPLSRIMQNIGFRYTTYLNRRKKRTGHIFQGRYKALLIDADSYLLELVRYIHCNPVRAISRPISMEQP
jgi:hypothetical protein